MRPSARSVDRGRQTAPKAGRSPPAPRATDLPRHRRRSARSEDVARGTGWASHVLGRTSDEAGRAESTASRWTDAGMGIPVRIGELIFRVGRPRGPTTMKRNDRAGVAATAATGLGTVAAASFRARGMKGKGQGWANEGCTGIRRRRRRLKAASRASVRGTAGAGPRLLRGPPELGLLCKIHAKTGKPGVCGTQPASFGHPPSRRPGPLSELS